MHCLYFNFTNVQNFSFIAFYHGFLIFCRECASSCNFLTIYTFYHLNLCMIKMPVHVNRYSIRKECSPLNLLQRSLSQLIQNQALYFFLYVEALNKVLNMPVLWLLWN